MPLKGINDKCEAPWPKAGTSREGNIVLIVPLDPALAGRGTCRPKPKCQRKFKCRKKLHTEMQWNGMAEYQEFELSHLKLI
jgi:hypothetical protein